MREREYTPFDVLVKVAIFLVLVVFVVATIKDCTEASKHERTRNERKRQTIGDLP